MYSTELPINFHALHSLPFAPRSTPSQSHFSSPFRPFVSFSSLPELSELIPFRLQHPQLDFKPTNPLIIVPLMPIHPMLIFRLIPALPFRHKPGACTEESAFLAPNPAIQAKLWAVTWSPMGELDVREVRVERR